MLHLDTSSRPFVSSLLVILLVGCGGIAVFDDGTGGQGGATTTSKTGTGTSKTSGTQSQTNSGIVATSSTIVTTPTQTTSIATTAIATTAVSVTTGTGPLLPCEAECQGDPGCDSNPPFPGAACGQCVFQEAMNIPNSMCAVNAAFGPNCQSDPNCSEFITCVLNNGNIQQCAGMNPNGIQTLLTQVFASCGRCGTCPTCQECCLPD